MVIVIALTAIQFRYVERKVTDDGSMVERRHWFSDVVPHVILILGVLLVAFPVWLRLRGLHLGCLRPSANGQMPIYPGPYGVENYTRALVRAASPARASRSA